jgi:hypothetical protein
VRDYVDPVVGVKKGVLLSGLTIDIVHVQALRIKSRVLMCC